MSGQSLAITAVISKDDCGLNTWISYHRLRFDKLYLIYNDRFDYRHLQRLENIELINGQATQSELMEVARHDGCEWLVQIEETELFFDKDQALWNMWNFDEIRFLVREHAHRNNYPPDRFRGTQSKFEHYVDNHRRASAIYRSAFRTELFNGLEAKRKIVSVDNPTVLRYAPYPPERVGCYDIFEPAFPE